MLTSAEGGSTSFRRHTRDAECPICGGYDSLPQGKCVRCAGFSLDFVVYCTREDYAGRAPLDISSEPPAYIHHLHGPCACGREHGAQQEHRSRPQSETRPREHELPLETRHAIFSTAIARLGLRREAAENLTSRGLSKDDIEAAGYRSIPDYSELNAFLRGLVDEFGETLLRKCPGFTDKNGRTYFRSAGRSQSGHRDGYIVPYRNEDGLITGIQLKRIGYGSYETARHSVTAEIYHVAGHFQSGADCYLTEGGLKAEVAHRLGGVTVIGLPGQALASQHVAVIGRLQPGRVIEALDHENNEGTHKARARWLDALNAAGLPIYRGVWEGSDVGGPKGLDDLFAAGSRARIRTAIFVPAATGEKRALRQVAARGAVDHGVRLPEARRQTRDAIEDFVSKAAKRR